MSGMETQRADTERMEGDSIVILDEPKLREIVASGSLHFDDLTSLISVIDTTYKDDVEKISLVYDSFLAEFPLCYGYWRKYAAHKMRLCTVDAAFQVFERAVQSVTFSVDLWVDYCSFACSVFKDPSDVHRLFKRGLSFVGKDYLCHPLWDKYIEFEFSQQHWSCLAQIYIQTLRFPTKRLHQYYNRFKQLVDTWITEMEPYGSPNSKSPTENITETEISKSFKQDEISRIIKDMLDPSIGLARFQALQKYRSIGEQSYQEVSQLDEKIKCFENGIRRSYFHVKPLDDSQLENWHHYLDFAELHRDFDWAVKLYERCLIPCANYPDFWMRYVEFMESKGAREIANLALARATQTFLKKASVIHMFSARFKEHIRDATNARAAFSQCYSQSDTKFVENVVMKANMERRLGNFVSASNIYKEALELAAADKEKCHILPALYIHFSRLKYVITCGEDAALDILIDGIKHVPHSKLLIEELIEFAMTHGGSVHINVVDPIVANAISPQQGVSQGLSVKDREAVSAQYLEFVDLWGTVHDLRKAWNQHVRLFPHSVRPSFHPATGKKQWKVDVEAANQTAATLHHQTSGECDSKCLIQSTSQDDKLSIPENHDSGQDIDQIPDQKLPENVLMPSGCVLDQKKSPFVENYNSVNQVAVDLCLSGEADNSIRESMHQVCPKVSESDKQDASEPNLMPQVADKADVDRASLDYSEEKDFQQEHNYNSEQNLKPPSLEGLSLDPRVIKSATPVSPKYDDTEAPASNESEDFRERSLSNRSMLKGETFEDNSISNLSMHENSQNANIEQSISSPVRTQATESSSCNSGNYDVSNSASNGKNKAWSPLQPQILENRGKNSNKKSNLDRLHSDSRYASGGHAHKRLHQRRQHSPPKSDPRERGSQVLHGQSYRSQPLSLQNSQARQDSQAQGQYPTNNVQPNVVPQAWSMQNAQQQSPHVKQSQPPGHPTVSSEAQIFQHPIQSNEQHANLQNNQAYNQMWQYYYYQQQLLWQQQQQLQQHPQQQQQQQQLQYIQQQHMQQQQSLHQPQQFQQFQHQQQEQQRLQFLQHQWQGQQMQPNQQQQILYLQQQQQQQLQQQMALSQQQQPELELGQPEQQISTLQDAIAELNQQSAVPQGRVTLAVGTSTGGSGTIEAPATSNP